MRIMRALGLFVVALLAAAAGFAPLAAVPLLLGETEVTANIDELMKITFDDTLIKETVTDTELYDLFPDGPVKQGSEGRYFETAHLYQAPGSIGSRSENGYIPTPNGAKAVNGRITLKKVMGSIEETAEVLKKIKKDGSAFVDWAKEQFPQFKESLADELDRQILGDGSGIRARVNAVTPAVTLVVDDTLGIAGLDPNAALMQFRRGMHLRASPNANGATPRVGMMTVDDIDWVNNAIVVDGVVAGLADDDYLFEGDLADNSAGKDMMGLYGMVDDGGVVSVLQNIDRTVSLWFQSYVNDLAGATALDESVVLETDKVARFRGGGRADTLITSEDAFNILWADLKLDRVINDPRSYTAGRKGIEILFGGTRKIEVRTARKMPSKVMFGLQRNQFRKFVLHDWEWDDTSGSIWKQVVDSTGRKDAFYAYGSMYGELGIKSPQKCWRLEDWT